MKTIIIAEAGVNHNGDIALAKELIDVASEAGADLVKFQTFKAENIATKQAPTASYQKQNVGNARTQVEILKDLELNKEQHLELIEYSKKIGIEFFSTAFDFDSIDLLDDLNLLSTVKIPSGEINNIPYLRYLVKKPKRIFLSTGMATMSEIAFALEELGRLGVEKNCIDVLHCVSEYPTKPENVNLHNLNTIRTAFGVNVGFSDHTTSIEIPVAAVALGASVIEKHFTLSRNLAGPDHKSSLIPSELETMISGIRIVEKALGKNIRVPTETEMENKLAVRKSIVAARNISAGEIFDERNITTKRPGSGISPRLWDEVIGKKASRDFYVDELIQL